MWEVSRPGSTKLQLKLHPKDREKKTHHHSSPKPGNLATMPYLTQDNMKLRPDLTWPDLRGRHHQQRSDESTQNLESHVTLLLSLYVLRDLLNFKLNDGSVRGNRKSSKFNLVSPRLLPTTLISKILTALLMSLDHGGCENSVMKLRLSCRISWTILSHLRNLKLAMKAPNLWHSEEVGYWGKGKLRIPI